MFGWIKKYKQKKAEEKRQVELRLEEDRKQSEEFKIQSNLLINKISNILDENLKIIAEIMGVNLEEALRAELEEDSNQDGNDYTS